jgi:hypothetical protein
MMKVLIVIIVTILCLPVIIPMVVLGVIAALVIKSFRAGYLAAENIMDWLCSN